VILLALAVAAAVAPGVTPVGERVAVVAALNKRNGQVQQFSLKPGETATFGALTIRIRTCETAPPWEARQTAAFVQIDEAEARARTATAGPPVLKRIFSGWMFAESPSLNPLTSGLYDVWVKSCTMRFPEAAPEAAAPKPARSKAPKSPVPDTAAANATL